VAVLKDSASGLEPEIPWHSALYFKNLKPGWRILYTCGDNPVVIERQWGRGSLVLAGDTYFLSNEGLRLAKSLRLLASLIGPSDIVFDEEHLGLSEQPNMAGLVRKYHLQGMVAGLMLLALLFVWQQTVRFMPPVTSADKGDEVVGGQEASAGFASLLRRTIKPSEILGLCVGEWRKGGAVKSEDVEKVDAIILDSNKRNPVETYRAIVSALQNRKISQHSKALTS
jgi:hypothetical protein